jgi:hypothetical protein
LQNRIENSDDGAERAVFALVETAQSVEVTEQLIRSIDEMDDHGETGGEACAHTTQIVMRSRMVARPRVAPVL